MKNFIIEHRFNELFVLLSYREGILRVRQICRDYGVIEPKFEEVFDGFRVTLFKEKINTEESNGELNDELNDKQEATKKGNVVDDVIDNVIDNVTENVTEDRELQILNYIKKNQYITTNELAKHLKVSRRTIMRDIDQLKTRKKLKRIGGDKGGYWKIVSS